MAIDLRQSSDGALVLAIARYHQDALAEVYRRHAGAVFGLANRLLGSRTLAEEVTQEIFLRLWNVPERFDTDRGTLRAMLLSWTHGKSVDVLRSDKSRRRREERDAHFLAEAGHDIENEAIELTIADQVARALAGLRSEEREAITLAYYRGLTYREVAAELDQPEGTVKSRIRSGLRTLRASLNINETDGERSGPERPSEREAGPERPSEREAGPERPSERAAGPERPSERAAGPERPSEREAGPERGITRGRP